MCLPPKTTSLYQPLDTGIISAVKRKYKGRLLRRVLRRLNTQSSETCETRVASSPGITTLATGLPPPTRPIDRPVTPVEGAAAAPQPTPPLSPPVGSSDSPEVATSTGAPVDGGLRRTLATASHGSFSALAGGPTLATSRPSDAFGTIHDTLAAAALFLPV